MRISSSQTSAATAYQGQGKAKRQGHIPPGLAKKQAEQLPDGNPWKAVLQKQEQMRQNKNQSG